MVEIPEHYIEIRIISLSGRELTDTRVKNIVEKYLKEMERALSDLSGESALLLSVSAPLQ